MTVSPRYLVLALAVMETDCRRLRWGRPNGYSCANKYCSAPDSHARTDRSVC